jgi:LuxR family maltose regulon positive regulatory protein
LHIRAAEWFERNELLAEAIHHALVGRDWPLAVRLIAHAANVTAFVSGQINTVLGWLRALPDEVMRSQPRLSLTYAWMLLNAGSIEAVEEHLVNAEQALPALEAAQARALHGEVAALKAVLASYRREISRTIELCRQAREQVPESNTFLRAAVANAQGLAYRFSGQVVEASQAFAEAITLGQAGDNIYVMMDSVAGLAEMQMLRGQLHTSAQTCRRALQFADERTRSGGPPLFDIGFPHVKLGEIHYEWNDLKTAAQHLTKGIELGRLGGNLDIFMSGHGFLARVKQAQGDPVGAREVMRTVEMMVPAFHNRFVLIEVGAHGARLALAQGNLEAATSWTRDYASFADKDPAFVGEFAKITLARVRLTEKRLAEALELLEQLRTDAEAAERTGSAIEILALQALAFAAQENHAQAMTALECALMLAEPEGYVRVFVDEGEPMKRVISNWRLEIGRTASSETASRLLVYTEKLLTAFGPAPHLHITQYPSPRPGLQSPLVESLSERELEVLRLIGEGLSNREIADRLVVVVGTVKWYINNIYSKLGIHSRTQALARAKELDLL